MTTTEIKKGQTIETKTGKVAIITSSQPFECGSIHYTGTRPAVYVRSLKNGKPFGASRIVYLTDIVKLIG